MAVSRVSRALSTTLSTGVNTALNAGSGPATIKFYTGTMPATPETAIGAQTLLGTLTCSDPAGTVSAGTLTFSPITADSSADATGTATWARIADSNGTAIMDVDVSAVGGGGMIQLNTVNIVAGGPISIAAGSLTF